MDCNIKIPDLSTRLKIIAQAIGEQAKQERLRNAIELLKFEEVKRRAEDIWRKVNY